MQLHRSDVVDGAIAILDQYGLADLTMRRLAGSLRVQPGALYWHFPNKQALLGAVADRILAPMADPLDATDWPGQLSELAHRLRNCLLAYRDGAELVSATYASRLTTSKGRERFAGAAIRAGMPRAEAELAAFTLLYYVLGHTVDEQSRMQMDSAGALTEAASPLGDAESADPTARFDFGLQLFVGGIRHLLGSRVR
ncbi:TetR/AcrR family transcriptional regulator C-terminal domain-containing protein [Nocardia cyriacigeorgica]|uniref:TetR/AcrR family transcriptional regulator C-terminal domain-containing protein n=1 Tax=Nocardia cyriacigeorgica TaxID=135487 RepID=UPI001895AFBE|nr:TetR/AcrR family transcriptional regulator C-terminal domain-containing protein [Nocardia cyriacigeorgica]MBF6084176.1 TetR/AcrR family transcriptional regulator C-terminal domain-containing protein [Nocardia cyriacigeorgica]MBF6286794.1 TetR/AcrR family transcriptional regulator C-terminal domain-containing protein [Nocardia cyriacigeorgica]MBF6426696.1 TetR/AcrR family transcriptional regulator C-terminal domain-containing protein [Nocardia cyriacigeorgica]BDU05838.1 putative transcription